MGCRSSLIAVTRTSARHAEFWGCTCFGSTSTSSFGSTVPLDGDAGGPPGSGRSRFGGGAAPLVAPAAAGAAGVRQAPDGGLARVGARSNGAVVGVGPRPDGE